MGGNRQRDLGRLERHGVQTPRLVPRVPHVLRKLLRLRGSGLVDVVIREELEKLFDARNVDGCGGVAGLGHAVLVYLWCGAMPERVDVVAMDAPPNQKSEYPADAKRHENCEDLQTRESAILMYRRIGT